MMAIIGLGLVILLCILFRPELVLAASTAILAAATVALVVATIRSRRE
jgi:predicted membrane metal-binding protein